MASIEPNDSTHPMTFQEFQELSIEGKKWYARSKSKNVADVEAELELADAMQLSSKAMDYTSSNSSNTSSLQQTRRSQDNNNNNVPRSSLQENSTGDDEEEEEEEEEESLHLLTDNVPHDHNNNDESLIYDDTYFLNPAISLKNLLSSGSGSGGGGATSPENEPDDLVEKGDVVEESTNYFDILPSELTGTIVSSIMYPFAYFSLSRFSVYKYTDIDLRKAQTFLYDPKINKMYSSENNNNIHLFFIF
jgi:hypothetical protein